VQGSGTPWIDFRGPRATIKTVSFSRALGGLTPAGTFRNKLVVVGAGNPTLHDEHPTATSPAMNGPEIQANTIWTVEHGAPLTGAGGWIDIALIVLLGAFAPVASLRLSALPALAVSGIVLAVFLASAQLAFNGGTVLAVTYPASVLTIGAIGALAVHYFTEVRERRRTRAAFARFVPAAVVDQVLEQAEDGLRLGGTEIEGTVMFSDIRGFTTFSEATPAPRVIEILNHYLTEMTEAILANGGTLVAFLGDGIMAVFGAPIAQPDHADRALRAAREMLDERLPRFNTWLREQGVADEFRMGIGLNSGPFMAGNVGSEQRLEYTVIGDTTNTAARLEGMTKGTPHQLFIADSTRGLLADETSNLVYVDEFAVRGRQAKIKIWSVAEAAAPER
jgi:adenylate cyclase